MAYTEVKLDEWLEDNPNYNAFPGTTSGKPLLYQAAADKDALSFEAKDWVVWDWARSFADLAQAPATADITSTGKINREIIAIVPDAPSASDIQVFLGEDTDEGIDALEGIVTAYQNAISNAEKFYIAHFMGDGKKSEIYQAGVSWNTGLIGEFPDPIESAITITPNLGAYHAFEVISDEVAPSS